MNKIERYKNMLSDLQFKISNEYKDKRMQIYSYIRLGLLAKYSKSIKAICYLDNKGFYEDANIILRTVFENFVTIVYCEINPTKYYKKFYDYNVITRLRYINEEDDEISKIVHILYKDEFEKLKSEGEAFKNKYKIKNKQYWTGMNLKKICEFLDKHYNSIFYTDMYKIVYMTNSEFIHPNIVNIFENYIDIENRKIHLNASVCRKEDINDIIDILEKCNQKLINIEFKY